MVRGLGLGATGWWIGVRVWGSVSRVGICGVVEKVEDLGIRVEPFEVKDWG